MYPVALRKWAAKRQVGKHMEYGSISVPLTYHPERM